MAGSMVLKVWKHDRRDAVLMLIGLVQIGTIGCLAAASPELPLAAKVAAAAVLAVGHWYCIAVVGHVFIHAGWFVSARAERVAAILVSLAMGQSATAYRLSHVRNHHRYNNDRQDEHGETRDLSSTFRRAPPGQHMGLLNYVIGGALQTFLREVVLRLAVAALPFGRVPRAVAGLPLARAPSARSREIRAIGFELAALTVFWGSLLVARPGFAAIWSVALIGGFALVNLQNYFEHFGADPDVVEANSVSHYGALYNLLTFNDGYHQEHHLRPALHWSRLPGRRGQLLPASADLRPLSSPWPAILGFLDRSRRRLELEAQPSPTGDTQ